MHKGFADLSLTTWVRRQHSYYTIEGMTTFYLVRHGETGAKKINGRPFTSPSDGDDHVQ